MDPIQRWGCHASHDAVGVMRWLRLPRRMSRVVQGRLPPAGSHVDVLALLQSADQVGVRLLPIPPSDLLHGHRIGVLESAHLLEEVFEASWTDELDDHHRAIGRVPKCVHDAAWLEQKAAFLHLDLVLPDQAADSAAVDEGTVMVEASRPLSAA